MYQRPQEAEEAFRIQKSDLSIRPVWHQRAERVKAHIFVCFIAYVLWKTLEKWQSRAPCEANSAFTGRNENADASSRPPNCLAMSSGTDPVNSGDVRRST